MEKGKFAQRAEFARYIASTVCHGYRYYNTDGSIGYVATSSLLMDYTTTRINGMVDEGFLTGPKIPRSALIRYIWHQRRQEMSKEQISDYFRKANKDGIRKMIKAWKEKLKDEGYVARHVKTLNKARQKKYATDRNFRESFRSAVAENARKATDRFVYLVEHDRQFRKQNAEKLQRAVASRKRQVATDTRMELLRSIIRESGIDIAGWKKGEFRHYIETRHPELLAYYPAGLGDAIGRDYRALKAEAKAKTAAAEK